MLWCQTSNDDHNFLGKPFRDFDEGGDILSSVVMEGGVALNETKFTERFGRWEYIKDVP